MTPEYTLHELLGVLSQLASDADDLRDRSEYAARLVRDEVAGRDGDLIGMAWGNGTATHLGACSTISLAFDLGLCRGTSSSPKDADWSGPLFGLIDRHSQELEDLDSAFPMLESDQRDPIDCHVCGIAVVP